MVINKINVRLMYKPYLSNDTLLLLLNLGDFIPSRIKPFSRVGEEEIAVSCVQTCVPLNACPPAP